MRPDVALNACQHGEPRGPQACALCRHAGRQGRDVGVSRVEASNVEWSEAARRAIRTLAATGRPFTAEDVVGIVGHPESPNAIGAAMLKAARIGLIYKSGMVAASRETSHARPLQVWRGARAPQDEMEQWWE